jgi:hypothetical protein
MNGISFTGQSLLRATTTALNVSALNTANLDTENYQARRVQFYQQRGGVEAVITPTLTAPDLATERVNQQALTRLSTAGVKLLRTQDEMLGELFDQWA